MNRERQRQDKIHAVAMDSSGCAPIDPGEIDLGLSLSVYSKDADGRLIEVGGAEPSWYGFTVDETWPTEQ